jgi:chromosome segregation ATPase
MQLEDALANLGDELTAANTRAEQTTDAVSALTAQLAEAAAERDAVVAARSQLAGALANLSEELDQARAELEQARGRAARLEKHAAWADEQIAGLVETEAEVLNVQLEDLRAELLVKEADLRARDELRSRFRARANRIIGAEMPPAASAIEVLELLHQRIRELERELDSEAMARHRLTVELNGLERSSSGSAFAAARRICLGLLEKYGLRRLMPRPLRRA